MDQNFSIDQKYIDALRFVYSYANFVDDWLTIKKELLKALNSDDRTAFSTRDPITKKQRTNEFERALATHWSIMSGRPVLFK